MDVSSTPERRCGPRILDSLPQDCSVSSYLGRLDVIDVSVGKPFTHAPQLAAPHLARSPLAATLVGSRLSPDPSWTSVPTRREAHPPVYLPRFSVRSASWAWKTHSMRDEPHAPSTGPNAENDEERQKTDEERLLDEIAEQKELIDALPG
ncbi:hypothetical protein THAOC_10790, partial [Thalassiosira oceanica]